MKSIRSVQSLFCLFACGCPVLSALFVETHFIFHCTTFCFFAQDWVYLYRSISGFSIPLINQFVYSLSIAYCLDYNSFICLEVDSVNLPTLSITFNTELAIFDHLPSHINFRISMSIFTKIICWCFKSACMVSVDVVGNSWHLDNIDLPIYKHGLSLHLFNSSLDLLSEFCSIPHIDLIHILLDLYLSFFKV